MMVKMTATAQWPGDEPERQFGWQDMFVGPDADPRGIGGVFVHHGDERTVLAGYLHDYRLTLELKCAGLDADAMARRSVEPSDLSLLGLVRHLSDAERYWFRQVMAGEDAPARYRQGAGDDHDRAFSDAVADPAGVALAWENWRAEVAFAERFASEASDAACRRIMSNLISMSETILFIHFTRRRMQLCREDGRVNPWKNSKIRLLPQNLSLRTIKQKRQKTNASGKLSTCSGNAFCPNGPQIRTGGLRLPLRSQILKRSLLSLGGRFTCSPGCAFRTLDQPRR